MFHDVRLPTGISFNSLGGPGLNTQIMRTDSGAEERIARWSSPLHRYNLRYAIKTRAQMAELRRFYWGRLGALHSFRFKDWTDFTTATDGNSAGAYGDCQIGVGDGTTTVFQLVKTYTSGGYTRSRTITKPVDGTVAIGVNGSAVGSGWSLNYATGQLTFSSAPALGHAITWGGEFDVHVRFGKGLDSHFAATLEGFDTTSLGDVEIVEVLEDSYHNEELPMLGAAQITSADNVSISFSSGLVQRFNFTASSKSATLPNTSGLPMGGPYLALTNSGANSFTLKKHDGTSVQTVASGASYEIWLGTTNGSDRVWIAT